MNSFWDYYGGFSVEDLDGKVVEFEITSSTQKVAGIGKLLARENPQGMIALEIEVTEDCSPTQKRQFRYSPSKGLRFSIERHENQNVATFRVSSYRTRTPG